MPANAAELDRRQRSLGPYSSKIIKAGALIGDTKTLLSHWDVDAPVDDNLSRVRRHNIFGKASRSRVEDNHQRVTPDSRSLAGMLGEDQVAEIERQVEAGKLSLANLDSLADKGKDISTGLLTLIFGSANPQEVALAFLHSGQHDEEIGKKEAQKELRHLLQVSFDIELPAAEALSNWRVRLGRHVLLTDLFTALKKQVPSSLSSVPVSGPVAERVGADCRFGVLGVPDGSRRVQDR
jgi:hypothetical protein